jgi:hypothetical protein
LYRFYWLVRAKPMISLALDDQPGLLVSWPRYNLQCRNVKRKNRMKVLLLCVFSFCAFGQPQAAAPRQPAAWDDSPRAADLAAQIARLKPLLDQLVPEDWVAQGGSVTFVNQWRTAQDELAALTTAATEFDRQPKRLTLALDTYFRLQSIEWRFESLVDGARRYQNHAIADQMADVLRGNSANRDGLRAYITDLAVRKEQEFTIVNADAQKCRVELSQIPTITRRAASAKK